MWGRSQELGNYSNFHKGWVKSQESTGIKVSKEMDKGWFKSPLYFFWTTLGLRIKHSLSNIIQPEQTSSSKGITFFHLDNIISIWEGMEYLALVHYSLKWLWESIWQGQVRFYFSYCRNLFYQWLFLSLYQSWKCWNAWLFPLYHAKLFFHLKPLCASH